MGKRIQYQMTRGQFKSILKTKKKGDNKEPYSYVMEYINNSFGLMGLVTKIALKG